MVTDGGLIKTDAFRLLSTALGADGLEKSWFLFGGASESGRDDVRKPAALFGRSRVTGVIAIGAAVPSTPERRPGCS